MISPEEMAELCLTHKSVQEKTENVLFFEQAAVIVFDGLIIWRGNLNMHAAVERLKLLAKALGLPIAVIQKEEIESIKKKKTNPGKFLGPGFWTKSSSWNSEKGLDPVFWTDYDRECLKVKTGDDAKKDDTKKGNDLWEDWEKEAGYYGMGYMMRD